MSARGSGCIFAMTATIGLYVSDFQERLQQALGNGYLLERELDGAGMSRVFVATERALQRTVVIKVLPPELAAGVNVDRFRREIQLAAQLQHPHIVPLLAAGEEDGLLWFSMPFIEGESLRQALARQGSLSPRDVVRILHDVVDALAYAHARGIVHRDIKPGNILTQGMHALVTDFGVAKALSEAIPLHGGGTSTGMAIGTPAYMAPEQLAADPAADHRVDIYAVGLLAYELLTGKSPFSGNSPQATLAAQLTHVPPAPHTLLSAIPAPLSAIIMRCLEKQASKRPDTAQALLRDLEALPPMTGSRAAPRPPGASTRTRAIVAGALVLGVAAWALTSNGGVGSAAPTGADSLDARDAEAGGARPRIGAGRTPTMRDGDSAAGQTSRETIPVFREVSDGTPSTAVQLVITRAESLAIADAVLKRQTASQVAKLAGAASATGTKADGVPTMSASSGTKVFMQTSEGGLTQVDRALIYAEVGRIFADSMSKALQTMDSVFGGRAARIIRVGPNGAPMNPSGALDVPPSPGMPGSSGRSGTRTDGTRSMSASTITPLLAPPSDGRPRIAVLNFINTTGKREYGAISGEIAHVLRGAIATDKFDVLSDEITDRASRTMPDRMSMGWGLRADYLLSGMVALRGDSLVFYTQLLDVRMGRFTRVSESSAPAADLTRAFDPSKAQVAAWLDTVATIAARRRAGGMGPGERR
jgi:serine/threonine-protein kinase